MGQQKQTTGKASNYFKHFRTLIKKGKTTRVVVYVRVSRCWQRKNGNLKAQKRYLRKLIRHYEKKYKVRIEVVNVFSEVASGWAEDRKRLIYAARTAKACKALLLAESSCRLIRSIRFHSNKQPDALPTVYEYEKLLEDLQGVTVATAKHPNTPWKKIKSFHSKRGQRFKNKRGGRPSNKYPGYKKERRKKYLKDVLLLYGQNHTIAEITRKIGIPRGTISDWIKQHAK